MSFKELTDDIIAQHHSLLRRELPNLSALIAELSRQAGDNEGASTTLAEAEKMYSKIRSKIETHLRDEETVLFPTGVALETGAVPPTSELDLLARLQEMEREHENCGKALITLKGMIGGIVPSDIRDRTLELLESVILDLDLHVEKENSKVHPRILELLKAGSVK